jgi:hypothetical protein
VFGPFGVGLWKHIRRGWDLFARNVRFEVGLGLKILLWHDTWCENRPLKHAFTSLYHCKTQRSMGEG